MSGGLRLFLFSHERGSILTKSGRKAVPLNFNHARE